MEKHTQGPLRVDYGQGTGKGDIFSDDPVFQGKAIARVCLPPIHEKNGYAQEAFDIAEANAVLFANAWDLLEAAKKALVIFDFHAKSQGSDWVAMRAWLRHAITEATKKGG